MPTAPGSIPRPPARWVVACSPSARRFGDALSVLPHVRRRRLALQPPQAGDGMGRGREVGYINVNVFGNAGVATDEYLSKWVHHALSWWLVARDRDAVTVHPRQE